MSPRQTVCPQGGFLTLITNLLDCVGGAGSVKGEAHERAGRDIAHDAVAGEDRGNGQGREEARDDGVGGSGRCVFVWMCVGVCGWVYVFGRVCVGVWVCVRVCACVRAGVGV